MNEQEKKVKVAEEILFGNSSMQSLHKSLKVSETNNAAQNIVIDN